MNCVAMASPVWCQRAELLMALAVVCMALAVLTMAAAFVITVRNWWTRGDSK